MVNITEMVEEHRKDIAKKTITIKELAEVLGISQNKARELTHAKGFPIIVIGRTRLVVLSKLDEWIENNLGLVI